LVSIEPLVTQDSANGESILVVEDNEDVRTFAVEMLTSLGYRVSGTADGPTALHGSTSSSTGRAHRSAVHRYGTAQWDEWPATCGASLQRAAGPARAVYHSLRAQRHRPPRSARCRRRPAS